MRAAISTRVSSDDQVQGASLPEQRKACLAYVERQEDWDLVDVFSDDGVSGVKVDFDDRPGFSKLLEAKPDVVVVQDSDRFGRNEYFWHKLLHFHHPEIRFMSLDGKIDTADPSKRMMQSFYVAIGADEAKKITERTMRGRVAKARKLRWPGGKPPYSMKIVYEELVLEPTEAEIVRDAAQWVLEGLSTAKVGARLNASKRLARPKIARRKVGDEIVRDTTPMEWNSLSVRRMLSNPALKGYVEWTSAKAVELKLMAENEVFVIPAPEILDETTWSAVQTKLGHSSSEFKPGAKIAQPKVYPLSRRLFTTDGHHMAGAYNKLKDRRRYRCSGRNSRWPEERQRHPHCHEVPAEEVEALVWREVSEHLQDPEWLLSLAGLDREDTDEERERRESRIAQLLREEREVERLKVDTFKTGQRAGLSPEEIRQTVDEYAAELVAKRDEREMLEEQSSSVGLRDERKQRLTALAKLAFKWMSDPSFQKQVYEVLELRVEVIDFKPLRVWVKGSIDERIRILEGSLSRGT